MEGLGWTLAVIMTLAVVVPQTFAGPALHNVDADQTADEPTVLSRTRRWAHHNSHHKRKAAFQMVRSQPLETRRLDFLKFDQEETNIGNHYNKDTGEFTAPVTGTYVFNLQVVASAGTYVEVSIQKTTSASSYRNYVNVMKAVSDKMGIDTTTGGQGTASAVLRLERGQKVTTSVSWIAGNDMIEGGSKTSFSGYLLH